MNYEVIFLEEKIVAGITIRTNNNDPSMTKIIGEGWKKFYETSIYDSILNKKNNNSIGLYTNYENKVCGDYDVMICCEIIREEKLPGEINIKRIPAGKYAKFVAKGNVQKAVAECWAEIWSMDLDRKYSFDFEEYKGSDHMDCAEIDIYISLN